MGYAAVCDRAGMNEAFRATLRPAIAKRDLSLAPDAEERLPELIESAWRPRRGRRRVRSEP